MSVALPGGGKVDILFNVMSLTDRQEIHNFMLIKSAFMPNISLFVFEK
jgi:hypothetical protein